MAEPDRPILLDTDVVSLLMRGSLDPAASGLRAYDWCVSYITVGELAKGAEMARWNLRRWTDLADWLGHVVILPVDYGSPTSGDGSPAQRSSVVDPGR